MILMSLEGNGGLKFPELVGAKFIDLNSDLRLVHSWIRIFQKPFCNASNQFWKLYFSYIYGITGTTGLELPSNKVV